MKVGIVISVTLLASSLANAASPNQAQQIQALQRELGYYKRAVRLYEVVHGEYPKTKVRIDDIIAMQREIDRNLPKYFPHGPFTREDFISLAMNESRLDKHDLGSSGEKGVFQIRPEYHHKGDLATMKVNTEMAMKVLRDKYREHPDYRKAIIAYNGYVVHNGHLLDGYWVRFQVQKARVMVALGVSQSANNKDLAMAKKLQMDVYGS